MDITKLNWTKNIKPFYPTKQGRWAYDKVSNTFELNWRNKNNQDEKNANKPTEGELILLRQLGRVTHIVKILDSQFSYVQTNAENEFNIYRHVEVVWITDNWDNPPSTDEFFEPKIHFPMGGTAYKLERIKAFKQRWDEQGLLEFQKHVQKELKIG
ncbi:MAG: hypothetical protein V7L14_28255 [Nostoc sp.]|uniref:hypothetical protein n=1 Tax=Nostoc sp. TaxID=1180 RepID=UPI002FF5C91B